MKHVILKINIGGELFDSGKLTNLNNVDWFINIYGGNMIPKFLKNIWYNYIVGRQYIPTKNDVKDAKVLAERLKGRTDVETLNNILEWQEKNILYWDDRCYLFFNSLIAVVLFLMFISFFVKDVIQRIILPIILLFLFLFFALQLLYQLLLISILMYTYVVNLDFYF